MIYQDFDKLNYIGNDVPTYYPTDGTIQSSSIVIYCNKTKFAIHAANLTIKLHHKFITLHHKIFIF